MGRYSSGGGAILLVVIGHSGCPELLYNLIYSFHMPLFFIISGYLYNSDKWNKELGFQKIILNRCKSYIKPYFVLCGVNMLFCVLKELISDGFNVSILQSIRTWIFGILYAYPSVDYMPNCTPLWFLVALFLANVLFYFIQNINSKQIQILTMLLVALINSLLYVFCSFQFPWCFGAVLIGVCCMYFGQVLRNSSWLDKRGSFKWFTVIIIIAIGLLSSYYNERVGIGANNLGNNPVLFWVSALSLSFSIISVAATIKCECRILSWVGKNTIIFMGFNYFFNDLPQAVWKRLPYIGDFQYTWYIKSIICVLCISCTIAIWDLIKKKNPRLSMAVGF